MIGGFLGSLMGSMEETHKSVAGTAAGERARRGETTVTPDQTTLSRPPLARRGLLCFFVSVGFIINLVFVFRSRLAMRKWTILHEDSNVERANLRRCSKSVLL